MQSNWDEKYFTQLRCRTSYKQPPGSFQIFSDLSAKILISGFLKTKANHHVTFSQRLHVGRYVLGGRTKVVVIHVVSSPNCSSFGVNLCDRTWIRKL